MKSTVVEAATSAAPPATVTQTASDGGQAFKLRRHVTVPTTAKAATAAATFGGPAGGPAASHGKALAEKPTGAAAAPERYAVAAAKQVAHAAPRAPFPLAAVGQEAPQAMARRMSTIAGMRSGEQLTSEDAFEATAGEKAEDAAEATPDEKVEDAEATADEKAEATAVGLGTAAAQWPKAGMQTRSSHRRAPAAFV